MLEIIDNHLDQLRDRFGDSSRNLARVALQYCLAMSANACVVVGFRDRAQLAENLSATGQPLTAEDIAFVDDAMSGISQEIGSYFAARPKREGE